MLHTVVSCYRQLSHVTDSCVMYSYVVLCTNVLCDILLCCITYSCVVLQMTMLCYKHQYCVTDSCVMLQTGVLCYRQLCCVTNSCIVLQIAKRMMEKKYRERITDGLQQLEQNGGQVSLMVMILREFVSNKKLQ